MKNQDEIDMSEGPLLPKLTRYILPLMLTNVLQIAFNTADLIVVGRCLGKNALAAVGSNNALVTLLVCVLIGLTTGVSVLTARYFGAKDEKNLQETGQTSLLTALFVGILVGLIGFLLTNPLLRLLKTPDEVLSLASLYLKIFFCGIPAIALYNFAAAILRAVGDTKHPLFFLTISGILNVLLNLLFVLVFHWGVAGVAIATVISESLACFLTIRFLTRSTAIYRVDLLNLHFNKKKFKELLYIGIPAGISTSLFSVSNMFIQSAINSLGTVVMAGNSAGTSIESFIYVAQDAIAQAALASVSQNVGANKYERTKRAVFDCTIMEIVLCTFLGVITISFRNNLIGIYTQDPAAVAAGSLRIILLCSVYFLNGCMNMMPCVLRGFGYSILPTVVSLIGICLFRVIWIGIVFPAHPTLTVIYLSYPITWTATGLAHYVCYFLGRKKAFERLNPPIKNSDPTEIPVRQ